MLPPEGPLPAFRGIVGGLKIVAGGPGSGRHKGSSYELWAIHPTKGIIRTASSAHSNTTHVDWFKKIGIPTYEVGYDRIKRGRAIVDHDAKQVMVSTPTKGAIPSDVFNVYQRLHPGYSVVDDDAGVGFNHIAATGTSEGAKKAWDTRGRKEPAVGTQKWANKYRAQGPPKSTTAEGRKLVEDYIKMVAPMSAKEKLLQDNGQHFEHSNTEVPAGPAKMCFMNAFHLASANPDYRYCEGLAVPHSVPLPVDHAWVVDKNNKVLDPTWKDGAAAYYGIKFKPQYVNTVALRSKMYGILSYTNPQIFKGEDKPEEFKAAAAAFALDIECGDIIAYGTSEGVTKAWDTRGRTGKKVPTTGTILKMHGWKLSGKASNPKYKLWTHPKYGELRVSLGAFKHTQNGALISLQKGVQGTPLAKQLHSYLKSVEGQPQLAQPAQPQSAKPSVWPEWPEEKMLSNQKVSSQGQLLNGGMNSGVRIVNLEDGTRAVFKPQGGNGSSIARGNITPGKDTEREIGAWEVAKRVGLQDMVPPVVEKVVDGKRGALLAYKNGKAAHCLDGDAQYDGKENLARAAVFDYVIGNEDRHEGNWLVEDADKGADNAKLHLIDHSLSFPEGPLGAFNHRMVNHAVAEFAPFGQSTKQPSDYAKPYIEARTSILGALKGLGLPKNAVAGVDNRIGRLATAKWGDLK